MQIALVVVFAATLGLAALLSQSRNRAMAVELSAKPFWAGKLAMRLPKGWTPQQDTDEMPISVIVRESKVHESIDRLAIVFQSDMSSGTPEHVLGQYLRKISGELGGVRPFEMLGHPAVLARFIIHEPIPDDPYERAHPVPAWFAAGVVPGAGSAGNDLAVVIGVRGVGMSGPAGERVIRQVAEALTVRGEMAATLPQN